MLMMLLLFSCSVVAHTLQPHGLQQSRFPCPPPSPQNLLKILCIESVLPSNRLILCRPLLPSVFTSITAFSNESALRIKWLKYWSFSFNISPSNEYSGLISFRMDWLDLFAVQSTHNSLLQHTVPKHQFLGTHPSVYFNSHICL